MPDPFDKSHLRFLKPSGTTHKGKTYEDHYANLEVDPTPRKQKAITKLVAQDQVIKPTYAWQKKRRNKYYLTAEWRSLRAQVLERDGNVCQYCNQPGVQADHIRPRRKKGADTLDNLVCACTSCNRVAGAKVFSSFDAKKAWIRKVRKL